MIRKLVSIEKEKCNGCGACANACHEGAIVIQNGKAVLLSDEYCDGLGDCLPACPMNAISIIEQESKPYNEQAVLERTGEKENIPSALNSWPVQLKLIGPQMSFLEGAHLLIAADCTAYAYASLHKDFMKNRVVLIGCPKLDGIEYSLKLMQILTYHSIKSITLIRMEVPCCKGIEIALQSAITSTGYHNPFSIRVISTKGEIISCY